MLQVKATIETSNIATMSNQIVAELRVSSDVTDDKLMLFFLLQHDSYSRQLKPDPRTTATSSYIHLRENLPDKHSTSNCKDIVDNAEWWPEIGVTSLRLG